LPTSRRPLTSAPRHGRPNSGREPIAATEIGADEVAVFAKSLAQREDLNLQVLLRDNNAWPHPAQELVFGDQLAVGRQQDQEKIEGARPQLYWPAVGDQLPLAQQHAKAAEFERPFSCCLARPIPGHRRFVPMYRLNRFHGHSPVEGVEQRIEANRALQAVLLHLRMHGCRLRIIRIKL